MRKKHKHFEQVPVEVVEKILEMQGTRAKRGGKQKFAAKKSRRVASARGALPGKAEVLVP